MLTKEELRRAVLQSLVNYRVDNAYIAHGRKRNDHSAVVGIARNLETDIVKLMEKAVQNDIRTFEENFGLEEIAPKEGRFDISSLQEPFILAVYYPDAQGIVGFYVSSHVQETDYNGQLSLYRRLLGYGKYYFYAPLITLIQECCDKNIPIEKRAMAYESSLRSLSRKSKLPKKVVPVSNCGKLLTERERDTGLNFHQPVFLKGE